MKWPWTEARIKGFVIGALRRARWPAKYQAMANAYVRDGINPKTNRKVKLYRCAISGALLMQKEVQVDHTEPVVPLDGKWGRKTKWLGINWNEFFPRLFCGLDNLEVISKEEHKKKTQLERKTRSGFKI